MTSKITSLSVLILALLLNTSLFVPAVHANVLSNGGFESGGSTPTGWSSGYSGSSPSTHAIFPTNGSNARTGSRYAELAIDSSDTYVFAAFHNNSGSAGVEYTLSAWIKKAPGSADGSVSLKLEFYGGLNKGDERGNSNLSISSNPAGWTYFEHTDTAPVGTNYVTATLMCPSPSSGVSTAWYDDVVLDEATAGVATDVVFDIANTQHTFEGFGTQIWADQLDALAEFGALNMKFIRITKDHTSYTQMQSMRTTTDALGIKWLYNVWSAPSAYKDPVTNMLTNVTGFAEWWKNLVITLDGQGVRPHYIDLMNEPDSGGQWSTGITPTQFNTLVKEVRTRLDGAGYTDVQITGPGLSAMGWADPSSYINVMDAAAITSIGVWANHTWDDGNICDNGAECIESIWPSFGPPADAADATKSKWITEYATKAFNFHGVNYPNPDDTSGYASAHSHPYAVRVYENTIALLNQGANATFYWSAEDAGKSWGYVENDGDYKPVYYTLLTLFPKIPVGAKIIQASAQGHKIYAAAFIKDSRLVIALVNDSIYEYTKNVKIDGVAGLNIVEAPAVVLDIPGDPCTSTPDISRIEYRVLTVNPDNSIDVTLPRDSTLTIVCDISFLGDADGDKKSNLTDFAKLALRWLDIGCGACDGTDFSGDGNVNLADVIILALNWLTDFTMEGFWKLDGNGNDSSYFGNDGTVYGSPSWEPIQKIGGSMIFDGIDDYVEITGYRGVLGTQSRSCAAWIKSADTGAIVSWGKSGFAGQWWLLRVNDSGRLHLQAYSGLITGNTDLRDNNWHHVAVVLESDGTPDFDEVKLYVDGIEETYSAIVTEPIGTASHSNVTIGASLLNDGTVVVPFTGRIDDVRIYKRVLSEAEILILAGMGN